jgi:hypothetical protein
MFELSCSASCNRASKSSIFGKRSLVGQDEMSKEYENVPSFASELR